MIRKICLLCLAAAWFPVSAFTGFAQSPTSPPSQTQSAESKELGQGIALLAQGKYQAAIAALSKYKQESPLDPKPYFYSGMAYTQAGELSPAAAELKEAVHLAPEQMNYRVFLANVYVRLKQTSDALKTLSVFNDKAKAEPLSTAWLHLLADVYFRLEQPDQSLAILQILEKRQPNDARTDYELGRVYGYKNQLTEAAKLYRKSIDEQQQNPDAYFELGRTLYQSNDMAGAERALLEAVQQEPNNPQFLLKLGDTYLALNKPQEAIKYLKQAEPSGTNTPEIYYALGRAYQRVGDRTAGNNYLQKFQQISAAQSKEKQDTIAVDRLQIRAETAADQGKKAEAQSLFEQVVKADPHRWQAHGYLAESFLDSGDLQQAHEHLLWMEKISPNSVVGNYLMARYWYLEKDYNQALTYASRAELARPGNSELRNLLGNVYLQLGQRENAVREFQEALRLAPSNAQYQADLDKARNSETAGKK